MVVSSATTGIYMKKTGKYKYFPTIGFAILIVPFALLGWTLEWDTSIYLVEFYLFLMGACGICFCVSVRGFESVACIWLTFVCFSYGWLTRRNSQDLASASACK
jgi:hypothetical protein